MYNIKHLCAAIERAEVTVDALCKYVGISESVYQRKLSGELEFTVADVLKLKQLLSLTEREIWIIFFDDSFA